MNKILIFLFSLLISFSSNSETNFSKKYILITFHGLGGYESENLDEATNISESLKAAGVVKMFNAGHGVSKRKFDLVLDNFGCQNGKQNQKDLGLIIIGYSWGARKSYEFSKTYLKKCGQKAERAYMIDGIQKLVTQFKHTPEAKMCKNFYKTISPIRGTSLKDCQNTDLTEICKTEGGGYLEGMPCHQLVISEAYKLVMNDISTEQLDLNL